jgi:MYXO-CTERM domain-containing protein
MSTCPLCAPGTFASNAGSTLCQTCEDGFFSASPGAATCAPCLCNDSIACTHDTCGPATGLCSAEPVAACEPVQIDFAGTVTELVEFGGASAFLALGVPFEGYYVLDPEAPDAAPGDPHFGYFLGAVVDYFSRIGTGPAAIESTADYGNVTVYDEDHDLGDGISISVPLLSGSALAGATRGHSDISLHYVDHSQIASDALSIMAPPPLFSGYVQLSLLEGVAGETFAASSDLVFSPEPGGTAAVAAAALAALTMLRRKRSGRGI